MLTYVLMGANMRYCKAGNNDQQDFSFCRTRGCVPIVNFLEVWNQNPVTGVISMADVINTNGYLGILTPNPTQPLEVAGNAL